MQNTCHSVQLNYEHHENEKRPHHDHSRYVLAVVFCSGPEFEIHHCKESKKRKGPLHFRVLKSRVAPPLLLTNQGQHEQESDEIACWMLQIISQERNPHGFTAICFHCLQGVNI